MRGGAAATQECGCTGLEPRLEQVERDIVGAKSAGSVSASRRKRHPLPCASSPHRTRWRWASAGPQKARDRRERLCSFFKNYTRSGRVLLDKILPDRYNKFRVQRQQGAASHKHPAENAANTKSLFCAVFVLTRKRRFCLKRSSRREQPGWTGARNANQGGAAPRMFAFRVVGKPGVASRRDVITTTPAPISRR